MEEGRKEGVRRVCPPGGNRGGLFEVPRVCGSGASSLLHSSSSYPEKNVGSIAGFGRIPTDASPPCSLRCFWFRYGSFCHLRSGQAHCPLCLLVSPYLLLLPVTQCSLYFRRPLEKHTTCFLGRTDPRRGWVVFVRCVLWASSLFSSVERTFHVIVLADKFYWPSRRACLPSCLSYLSVGLFSRFCVYSAPRWEKG